jgi:subtilase family serine protease
VQNIGYRPMQGQYSVRVANVGDDVATGGGVKLFVDGTEAGSVSLPDVPAGETRSVQVAGPACEGFVQAVADPAATVRESSENDNARTESCSQLRPG